MPVRIDGTDITGATIDGTDVTEITVDGQTVFTAGTPVSFMIDDFEDGNTSPNSPWSGYTKRTGTGGFSTTTNALDGNFSVEYTASNDFEVRSCVRSSQTTNGFSFIFNWGGTGNANDYFAVQLQDDADFSSATGTLIDQVEFRGDGTIVEDLYNNVQIGTWPQGATNRVDYDYDFNSNTVDVILNGATIDTHAISNVSGIQNFQLVFTTGQSGNSSSIRLDNIAEL